MFAAFRGGGGGAGSAPLNTPVLTFLPREASSKLFGTSVRAVCTARIWLVHTGLKISCTLIIPDGRSWQCNLYRRHTAKFVFYKCTDYDANCTNCAQVAQQASSMKY